MPISRTNEYAQNRISHSHNHRLLKSLHTETISLLNSTGNLCIHTWATRHCQHCCEWVNPCSSLKADWVFLFTMWFEMLGLLPTLMAWLDYFQLGFAQILLRIKVPNSSTYKSHRNTSQLKQRKTKHSNYSICKHILALSIFHTMSWRGLLGPNPSVGHPKLTVLF